MLLAADLDGLSNAMNLLIRNPHQAMFMRKASRALAEGHPNQETFDEHERMYHKMVREIGTQQIPVRVEYTFSGNDSRRGLVGC